MTIAIAKSLRDYRIIYGLAEYNLGDDKQSDGFIRRCGEKKWIKIRYWHPFNLQ
jgi:hypothetical protein